MKKFFVILASLLLMIGVSSCNSCTKKADTVSEPAVEVVSDNVAHLVSLDRENMFLNYGQDYKWYETCVVLKDFLDEENDGTVTGVSNIFQVLEQKGEGYDVHVVMFTHVGDVTETQVAHTFWVEDRPMNDDEITVTFEKALELINQVNMPKPHSRQAVLRKEIGPLAANPQWIFGNQAAQIYVDAVTGEVRDYNPVYPKEVKLNYAFTW